MYKLSGAVLRNCKPTVFFKPCVNNVSNKFHLIPTRQYNAAFSSSPRSKYVFYAFPGLAVGAYIAYNAVVECEESVISDFVDNIDEKNIAKWKLYQYETCPFCCKVRAFLDYYDFPYEKVEVNPVTRKEIKFSEYRKVPFIKSNDHQINDSSLIISVLRSHFLGKEDVSTLLTYYPFLKDDVTGKGEFSNVYNIMYHQGFTHAQNKAIREELKWRRWVDESFVHTLSPNIYRTMQESLQAMEYITKVGNFTDFERKIIYYSGAVAMYLIGKRLRHRHHLRSDVRQSLYEEANLWNRVVGNKPFMGGKQPNLADLNMYGVISAIEGYDAFDDLMKNTAIGPWYKRMKKQVKEKRGSKDPHWITLVES